MEYTFALHVHGRVAGLETVVASSNREAFERFVKLGYHCLPSIYDGETVEIHHIATEPVVQYPELLINTCQVCKWRPIRRVISTPWDTAHPFLFICDTLSEDGKEWHCMEQYARENDCKKFDLPPSTMEYSVAEWVLLQNIAEK